MKLSEAIRIGAEKRPQAFGQLADLGQDGWRNSCAVAAALEATGTDPTKFLTRSEARDQFDARFADYAKGTWLPCPVPKCDDALPTYTMILHLNDVHQWTREAIADYVETIEQRAA